MQSTEQNQQDPAATPAVPVEYDYDRAFRVIELVQRAAGSRDFYDGMLAAYELLGISADAFTAAVADQWRIAADDLETSAA
jgi:hypothetical protein